MTCNVAGGASFEHGLSQNRVDLDTCYAALAKSVWAPSWMGIFLLKQEVRTYNPCQMHSKMLQYDSFFPGLLSAQTTCALAVTSLEYVCVDPVAHFSEALCAEVSKEGTGERG